MPRIEVVRLTREQRADVLALAGASHGRWGGHAGLYPNAFNSHVLGRTGEVAVETWARAQGLEVVSLFRQLEHEDASDLLVATIGVEVKTWAEGRWDRYGRCVRPGQLGRLRARSDVVVWVSAVPAVRATLRGWSTPDEVAGLEVVTLGGALGLELDQLQMPVDRLHELPVRCRNA